MIFRPTSVEQRQSALSFLRNIFQLFLVVLFAALFTAANAGEARAATVNVPAGGDLQAALNAAQPGDTILLQPGATYTGPFTLPLKSGSSFITVRTAASDSSLPADGSRVTPAYSGVMPKLVSPGGGMPALMTAPGAHHYRFLGIEFKPTNSSALVYDLIDFGDGSSAQSALTSVPHDLIIDRCYIHGDPVSGLKRGVALNSASTQVVNSYISDCKGKGQDTQAIAGWNGPGPFTIVNNYLEGAGENVLFGGADPSIPNLVPSDIVVQRNQITKPVAWRGVWLVKNLMEIKNAQRVTIDGNLLENNWADAQNGYAVLFTPRNQDGTAPWSVVQDVQFTNNILRHTGSAIDILGTDDEHPSQQTKRITISNNLFDDVSSTNWGGDGRILVISGTLGVTIDHNTGFQNGPIVMAYGSPTTGFVFTNNVMPHNAYGIYGDAIGTGEKAMNTYLPSCTFRGEVLAGVNSYGGSLTAYYPSADYPGNYYPASLDAVGFVDRANGNYRLASSSPYKGKATDGTDAGCNFDALQAAMAAPAATPTATPTPTPLPVATPTPAPTATPTPTPAPTPSATPTPSPTPAADSALDILTKTRRDAQDISNQLIPTTPATNSPVASNASASATATLSPADRIAAVVAGIQQVYAAFGSAQTTYPAAARIQTALSNAITYAASAGTSASQNNLADAKTNLEKAIDNLELADVLMVYGNVSNPVDYSSYFVRQHYVDFLGREPDDAGRAYWTAKVEACGADQNCRAAMRVDTSAAFFLSIEFQQTGYLVERLYRASFGRTVLLSEFLGDTQSVEKGLVVGATGWQDTLAANKKAFLQGWVQRSDFQARYGSLTNAQFVDSLYFSMGVVPQPSVRDALVSSLQTGAATRADVLAQMVDDQQFTQQEFNRAFVLMQYFGYLRRDPDQAGYDFWLSKLNQFGGDYNKAEMVKAFLTSTEYRQRFTQQ
jgi:hypothetical protein